jgi:O-antigen/teichoic acid export membrane protein
MRGVRDAGRVRRVPPMTTTSWRRPASRATARRLGWGLADQAVSSITNFVLGLVIARSLSATAFGAFSLAWVTYGVVLNVSRGLATDPLTVRYSGPADARWRAAMVRAASTATSVGVTVGVACVLGGVWIGNAVGPSFVALGIVLPALMLQDSWRFAFFASGQGKRAFLNDSVWAVALVPAMLLAGTIGTAFAFMLAWGGAAAAAAAFGCLQTRCLPRLHGVVGWLGEHRELGARYAVENLSDSASAQLRLTGLGMISGLASVAAVRGAQLLQGPFVALRMGISLMAVPEAARVLQRRPHRLLTFCLLLGGSQAFAGLLWGGALLLLPTSVGTLMLGSLWPAAIALIVPTTVAMALGCVFDGAFVGLRALGVARRSLRAQVTRAVAGVVLGLAGAFVDGAKGMLWGATLASLLGVVVVWGQLRTAARAHLSDPPPTSV